MKNRHAERIEVNVKFKLILRNIDWNGMDYGGQVFYSSKGTENEKEALVENVYFFLLQT
jgi:hypothetical protein